jgi:hypothetical protein
MLFLRLFSEKPIIRKIIHVKYFASAWMFHINMSFSDSGKKFQKKKRKNGINMTHELFSNFFASSQMFLDLWT